MIILLLSYFLSGEEQKEMEPSNVYVIYTGFQSKRWR